jgi:putative transcriptional regulator
LERLTMAPQQIRELRRRLQLTQEDFAHMIGVTFSTVNRWENGKSQPNRIALRLLANLEKKTKVT